MIYCIKDVPDMFLRWNKPLIRKGTVIYHSYIKQDDGYIILATEYKPGLENVEKLRGKIIKSEYFEEFDEPFKLNTIKLLYE